MTRYRPNYSRHMDLSSMEALNEKQLSRMSRKDLQALQSQSRTEVADWTPEASPSGHGGGNSTARKSAGQQDRPEHAEHSDIDDLDDFSIHDLKNVPFHSDRKPTARESDLNSTSSSSAASTVIHNPNTASGDSTLGPSALHSNVSAHVGLNLQTLESDPEFQSKLRRSLRLSNINNDRATDVSALDMDETLDDHTANDEIAARDEIEEIDELGEISLYQDEEENEALLDQESDGESDNSSSLDSMDDLTDDRLSSYMHSMFPSPPSSPPRELDPTKLYALYDFNGPDPSHLPLSKNDSVLLLNDSDSYWWLVRKVDDNRIGFAPAEILETYSERLARLNCWKNEILERGGYKGLKLDDEKILFCTEYPLHHPKIESSKKKADGLNGDVVNHVGRKGSLKKPKQNASGNTNTKTNNNNDDESVNDPNTDNDNSNRINGTEDNKKSVSFADINENEKHSIHESSSDSEEVVDDRDDIGYDYSSSSLLDNYQNLSVDHLNLRAKEGDGHDDSDDESTIAGGSSIKPANTPLIVPKKRNNFLIKNLDDYNYSSDSDQGGSSADAKKLINQRLKVNSPDSLNTCSSADTNSLLSGQPKNDINNITVSTYSGSSESLQHRHLRQGQEPAVDCNSVETGARGSKELDRAELEQSQPLLKPLNIVKTRKVPEHERNANGSRLESLKMLDDILEMYPEFIPLEDGSSDDQVPKESSIRSNVLGAGYRSNVANDATAETEKPGNGAGSGAGYPNHEDLDAVRLKNSLRTKQLHPKTIDIFNPVFTHIKQLDELLNDIQNE